jgi:2,3-dihydroxybiphenyl 1,2-dioxygenase
MTIQGLGYVGVRAKSLEDWAGFGEKFLGLQRVDQSRTSLAFRMDDRKQRVVVTADGGEGVAFFGWEVADVAAFDACAARLEQAGVAVTRGTRALADERRVADLIAFDDPVGNRLEVAYGAEVASTPFKPGRNISGFRTGPLGMGHAVLHVKSIHDVIPFYRDVLGFRLSDFMTRPFNAYFFHANPRHHSIAFIETGRNATHHLMVELFNLDDVGQGYDLALGEEGRIGVTLGRHINDEVTSFYSNSPSGFMVEYGWGGRVIDVAGWQPQEVTWGPSMWGHDRMWMPPEGRVEARKLRISAAASGLRKPVNVIDGNHERMAGVCPWWDGVRNTAAAE